MRRRTLSLPALLVSSLAVVSACAVEDDTDVSIDELAVSTDALSADTFPVRISRGFGVRRVTLRVGPLLRIPCRDTCNFDVPPGATLTVETSTGFDYANCMYFDGWEGSCTGTADQCAFVVDGPETVTARWRFARWTPEGRICLDE